MSKITDYAFLFQKTFGTSGENVIGSFQLSQLNSSSVQSQLKAAGYTLEKYERIYRQAFYDAAKKADPNWEIGKPIKDGALDSVTRELAESGKSPASGEKTFYTAETPKVYQIFTTDNMLWTGGNGTGLSYCLKYADDWTDENPVVLAKGVDENGKEFEQRIYINDVDPSSATVVEMRALEAHYKVQKQGGFTSLPLEAGNMGLKDRRDFISMFKECIEDLNKLGRFDLSLLWTKSMDAYLDLTSANSKYK